MQNKPNFPKQKTNITIYGKKVYENFRLRRRLENKAKTNPKQTQFAKYPNERKYFYNKGL